ncbi:hypothetical protein [Rhodomicrobium lacus]|uniref:hypothetical protein n=1 Tax=Rhodomicrobium lacus TaxID=2498452 RepID=UPI000F8CB35C|nr:hypothetical protein [Rhodomicrobium lacus]
MTPEELKAARRSLAMVGSRNAWMSCAEMAALMRLKGASAGRTIRRWEDGSQDVPGPAIALLETLLRSREAREINGVLLKKDD